MGEIMLKFDLKSGECKVEASGFVGSACQDATKFLKKALGESSDFKKKAEWYQVNIQRGIVSNRCG